MFNHGFPTITSSGRCGHDIKTPQGMSACIGYENMVVFMLEVVTVEISAVWKSLKLSWICI